ncbi:hypothetical protein FDECE_2582 [Fusarium decemcellulare]|nr:hypothetical protein FDECE_2582 [Fusarium decemcellulare]
MIAKNLFAVVALAATGLATNLHVNVGCIKVGGTHEVCASDDPYPINGDSAQITCKLDANPTLVLVTWPQEYGDIYWTADDCMVDARGWTLKCAP